MALTKALPSSLPVLAAKTASRHRRREDLQALGSTLLALLNRGTATKWPACAAERDRVDDRGPLAPVARHREGGGDEEVAERAPRGAPLHLSRLVQDPRNRVACVFFLRRVLRELLFRRASWVPWVRPRA